MAAGQSTSLLNQVVLTKQIKPCKRTPGSNGDPLECVFSKISNKNQDPEEGTQDPDFIPSLVEKAIKTIPKSGPSKRKREEQWVLLQKQRKEFLEEAEKSKNGSEK